MKNFLLSLRNKKMICLDMRESISMSKLIGSEFHIFKDTFDILKQIQIPGCLKLDFFFIRRKELT